MYLLHLLICSSIDGCFGCSHALTVVTNAALKFMCRFLCECICFCLLGRHLGLELLGHIIPLGLRNCQIIFKEAAQVYIPSSNIWG